MTTSITDARFTSLHYTPGHLLSLTFDEPPETGWSVMPGYDQSLPIPPHLEPPRLDADETLPSQLHPSYPFGRPPTLGRPRSNKPYMNGPTNLLGTIGAGEGIGFALGSSTSNWSRGGGWDELGLMGILEPERRKEVPPGMAGAKRPPSPPSPSLIPGAMPPPRSQHLRNLYARQRQGTPPPATDPFDAPVPNETYAEGEAPAHQQSQQRPQHTHQGQQSQGAPTFNEDGGSTVGERIVGIRGGRVSDEGLQGTRPTTMTQRTPSFIGGRHRGTQEDDRMGDMSADDNGESFSTRE